MVRVVCDVAGLRKAFDYVVPEDIDGQVDVGTSVRVALHGRKVSGWVVADRVDPPVGVSLSPILAVRGMGPPPAVVELAQWAAWRWAGSPAQLLRTASSPTLVRSLAGGAVRSGWSTYVDEPALEAGLSSRALAGGTTVVRLAPAHDPFALVMAAAATVTPSDRGAGALVLAPSVRAASRLAQRLSAAGHRVALLPDDWAQARAGGCVAVGTRAAAFAPLPALSAAVVVDAHDEVYVEERTPAWWAWRVAVERARRDGAPCALVSPCPTLDLLAAGRLVTTERTFERAGWSTVEVVDRRSDDPRTGLYPPRLVELLRWAAAEAGRRMVCVLNRTGRARLSACLACGELTRCERCASSAEVLPPAAGEPGSSALLHCRRCSHDRPAVCSSCGSTRFKVLRVGVTRAREELEALAQTPVGEVTSSTGPTAELPADLRIMVGTEAVLHRVTRADVVAFLDFDAELLAPRLRAAEEALSLVARAARMVGAPGTGGPGRRAPSTGVVGAGRAPGRVLVPTRQPDHPIMRALAEADPSVLSASEMEVRAELGLPPVRAQARVSGDGAAAYGPALAAAASDVEVRGPVEGAWSLMADGPDALCALFESVPRPAGRLRVEVDPVRA